MSISPRLRSIQKIAKPHQNLEFLQRGLQKNLWSLQILTLLNMKKEKRKEENIKRIGLVFKEILKRNMRKSINKRLQTRKILSIKIKK
jgi:hypothetical protein